MRRGLVAAVAALVALSGCSWVQWGGNAEHGGAGLVLVVSDAALARWTARRVVAEASAGPTVGVGQTLFVVQAGRLLAVDAPTGAIDWSAGLPPGSVVGGVPAIARVGVADTVFVTVATPAAPVVVGFDAAGQRNCDSVRLTCAPVFLAPVGDAAGPATPLVVFGGRLIVPGAGTLFAFDAAGSTNCATARGTSFCSPLWSAAVGATTAGIGPTATGNGLVYQVGGATLHAIDQATGGEVWSGSLPASATATPSVGGDGSVFVPAGAGIAAFAGIGCGASSCAPTSLLARPGGSTGDFASTPIHTGGHVYATTTDGRLVGWPATGCGSSCAPTVDRVIDDAGTGDYAQTPVVAANVVFVLARRDVSGVSHVLTVAALESDGSEITTWDLGTGGLGADRSGLAIQDGKLFATIAGEIAVIGAPPPRPLHVLGISGLALAPAFDPAIFDYVARCDAGPNPVTVDATAVTGGQVRLRQPASTDWAPSISVPTSLAPDQAAVVVAEDADGGTAEYWIRCLPPDFPTLTMTPHPATGVPTPGWYLLGNNVSPSGVGQFAMILDQHGTPVWYRRGTPQSANVTPIVPNSVAFMGDATAGGLSGPDARFEVHDLAAGTTATVGTVGVPTDVHELRRSPDGNDLLLSYPLRHGVDLTGLPDDPAPGPDATIVDCVVQEVDPHGNLVWQWAASDHFDPPRETTTIAPATVDGATVYDVFHCNSIDPMSNGDLLVSARHMNAVFEVRRSDGQVLWKLGGTPTNHDGAEILAIMGDPNGGPVQQHDARVLANGHVTVFDNQLGRPARGAEYSLDLVAHTATLVRADALPEGAPSCCMGDYRIMPDGHRVIGWGYVPGVDKSMTELDPAGQPVLDIGIAGFSASYRAVKVPPSFYDIDLLRRTAGT